MKPACENARAIRERRQTDSVADDLFPRKRIQSSMCQTGKKAALTDLRLHQIRHILPSCMIVLPATSRFYAFNVTNTHSDFRKRMTRSQIFDKKQDEGDRETNKNQ